MEGVSETPLTFHKSEVVAILTASLAIKDTTKPDEAAKRWVPWLCAYTGARAGEICQLRGSDVFKRDGVWGIRLTPAAGTIKNRRAREVPLHADLLTQGFLQFVKTRGEGALFYSAREEQTEAGVRASKSPAAQARQRLATWVRTLGVSDKFVGPTHGWRHTFKREAERCGISEKVSDYITGHANKSVARGYGAPTLEDMAEALKRFPRYEV